MPFVCKHCGRSNFKGQKGLTQHLNSHSICSIAEHQVTVKNANVLMTNNVENKRPNDNQNHGQVTKKQAQLKLRPPAQLKTTGLEQENQVSTSNQFQHREKFAELPDDGMPFLGNSFDSDEEDEDTNQAQFDPPVDTKTLAKFKEYVMHARRNFDHLSKEEIQAIKLMRTLRKKKAPLDAYEAVMLWHFQSTGAIDDDEGLGQAADFIGRKTILSKLFKRYNKDINNIVPKKTIVVPKTQTKVDLIWHDAKQQVVSLLTDPRVNDDDYLFFDNDPFAPPPENLDYICDINTGSAYTETYKRLITKPGRQVLCPIVMYIDGAVTDEYNKLEVTALQMTLGIFNKKARDQPWAWRTLGYLPNFAEETCRAKTILRDSEHLAAATLYVSDGEGGENETPDGILEDEDEDEEEEKAPHKAVPAQDLHTMLKTLLASYRKLEGESLLWELNYRGKLHTVEFVFYLAFVKCDTMEADLLCGQFKVKTQNIAMLCRYCMCPTSCSDDQNAKFPYKTEPQLQRLYERGEVENLRKLSQQPIQNAFHGLRFGLQNERGIHGACPLEILHAVLLGIFMRMRDCFFKQIGPTSKGAGNINALSKLYGKLFTRQSDRDLPTTNFGHGIAKGKLTAKEYAGVMLLIAAICQSTEGKRLLKKQGKKKNFGKDYLIADWQMLIETLICWEQFLCKDRMKMRHVKRLSKKHRYLMYMMKKVANRTEGMGMKFIKFHAILHICHDILMHGIPMNVDTGSNEGHHKGTKKAAKQTQKNIGTFDHQTALRLEEFHMLELAILEIMGKKLWEYFDLYEPEEMQEPQRQPNNPPNDRFSDAQMDSSDTEDESIDGQMDPQNFGQMAGKSGLTGTQLKVFWDDEDEQAGWDFASKRVNKPGQVGWDDNVVDFLYNLQEHMRLYTRRDLVIRCEHKRNGQIFRGHPHYRKQGLWNDWVIVDWNNDGHLPCEIWCFVDLTDLADGTTVKVGPCTVQKGLYAVCESSIIIDQQEDEEHATNSELFTPIMKEVEMNEDTTMKGRKFYLADVEAFVSPCVVIPDVGSDYVAKYFLVTPRCEWAGNFEKWLDAPHHYDVMSDEEEASDE